MLFRSDNSMKLRNTVLIVLFSQIMFVGTAQAIGGLGLQLGQATASIPAFSIPSGPATLTTTAFSNPITIGGYFYIDAIPFVDLEADILIKGQEYDFNFVNALGTIGPFTFGWGSISTYLSFRKKLMSLSLPLLAKAKLYYGGGYNMHKVTPLMTVDLMKEFMDGDIESSPTGFTEKDLINKLEENLVDASGFHVQAGLQFKLFMLDSFLFYRYTLTKDVIPDNDGFGSINLRVGIGI